MSIPESRRIKVFLDDIAGLTLVERLSICWLCGVIIQQTGHVAAGCCIGVRVHLSCVIRLFLPQEIFVLLLVLLRICVYLGFHDVEVAGDEDSSALAACLWLSDEENSRHCFSLRLTEFAV